MCIRDRIDILYKVVGDGTKSLSSVKIGDSLSLMGPIGRGFTLNKIFDLPLLLGGGVGIPPIVFLAKLLKSDKYYNPLVLMGSQIPFPFTTQPSAIMLKGLPNDVIAGMPLMESWQVASRLCSKNNFPGCYEGYVDEFARIWLNSLEQAELSRVAIFSCGPEPMLKAVASLAKEFMNRVITILNDNNVDHDKRVVAEVINKYFPDWRRVLNELQRYSISGTIDAGILVDIAEVNIKELMHSMKNKEFTNVRKWVVNNLDNDPVRLFRRIYDNLYEFVDGSSIPHVVVVLGEYQYKAAFVADQEINLMACFTAVSYTHLTLPTKA